MPRSLVLGNGNLLVTFDHKLMIRDLYYPYVGMEDHTTYNHFHRIGVWIDNRFSWLYEDSWQNEVFYEPETLVSQCKATNHELGLEINFSDCVLADQDILVRKIKFKNLREDKREFRIFFHQDFHIYGEKSQDTGLYEPISNTLIHYRKRRYFLINGQSDLGGMATYSIGKSEYQGFVGTWKDAEDGSLQRNPIAQGSVDSTIGFEIELENETDFYYWMCAGKSFSQVNQLNQYVIDHKPENLINQTKNYWNSWVNKREFKSSKVPEQMIQAFKHSLLVLRTQIDNRGAIIAANDSDIMKFNKDTYTYMWPRDGAMVALTLDSVGYGEITKRFYKFCAEVITDGGFLLHKYNPDKSLGSSWHPWFKDGKNQLPIQEDETALVIYALAEHYRIFKDLEFVKQVYDPLVTKGANFMLEFIHPKLNLPFPTYDLWEMFMGVNPFTCSSVVAGLRGAAMLADAMGDHKIAKKYAHTAEKMKEGILTHLWDEEQQMFYKKILFDGNGEITEREKVVEGSNMGLFLFKILPPDDPRVVGMLNKIKERLWVKTEIGGLARFERDYYQKGFSDSEFHNVPGNPWLITTLWYAQWLIGLAKTEADLQEPRDLINWTLKYSNSAFIMPEQLDPYSGAPVSVAPLTWSHATFVDTVLCLAKKTEEVCGGGGCEILRVSE